MKNNKDIFVNCPFDKKYKKYFNAIIFTVIYCAYNPRCALETSDSSKNRLERILEIIKSCSLSIHDISRTALDQGTKLPRFNMPFELGIVIGAKNFGSKSLNNYNCLIVESVQYQYQKYLSDIAGHDIPAYDDDIEKLIKAIRNWLNQFELQLTLPGYTKIFNNYDKFRLDIPQMCKKLSLENNKLEYIDFIRIVVEWCNIQKK